MKLHDIDLIDEIESKITELDITVKQLAKSGYELAEAEKNYKIAINKRALELRAKNVAVGMINLTIYGYEDIAELRLKRDIAEVLHQTNLEHINATKLTLRILENQLSREWGNVK